MTTTATGSQVMDPVLSWTRFVSACNERDWETVENMTAADFQYVLVAGSIYNSTPTRAFDKPELLTWLKKIGARGWKCHIHSIAGSGDTVIVLHDNDLGGGDRRRGQAIVQFDERGCALRMYEVAP